jgi:hypothetical protein
MPCLLQGLVVETVAKVPYLCRGDGRYPYYILYDAILVCRAGPVSRAVSPTTAGTSSSQYDSEHTVGVGASPLDRKLSYRDAIDDLPSKLDLA